MHSRVFAQTSCSLALFNMTDENIIISARLPHDAKVIPMELLRREKVSAQRLWNVHVHRTAEALDIASGFIEIWYLTHAM